MFNSHDEEMGGKSGDDITRDNNKCPHEMMDIFRDELKRWEAMSIIKEEIIASKYRIKRPDEH